MSFTGLIKANFPARVSFRVATKSTRAPFSRQRSQSLLGRGDMLYFLPAPRASTACMGRM